MTHGGGAALDMSRLHNNTQWHRPTDRRRLFHPPSKQREKEEGERKHEIEMGKEGGIQKGRDGG